MAFKDLRERSDEVREIDPQKLTAGSILAAWFLANPNGPTVFSVGIAESDEPFLFYQWQHFTGGRSWVLGALWPDVRGFDEDFGAVIFNALIKANNHFALHPLNETPPLASIPSFLITNKSPSVDRAIWELVWVCLSQADWGREIYYRRKYGSHFFTRAGEETREAVECARVDPNANQESVDLLRELNEGRPGFDNWQAAAFESHGICLDVLKEWWVSATGRETSDDGLLQFAKMWAGATRQITQAHLQELIAEGNYVPFDQVAGFFDQFQMPLWPEGLDDAVLCRAMGLSTDHLDPRSLAKESENLPISDGLSEEKPEIQIGLYVQRHLRCFETVEAIDIQLRSGMGAAERRAKPPWIMKGRREYQFAELELWRALDMREIGETEFLQQTRTLMQSYYELPSV